jgi:hypothetical protein
MGVAQVAVFLVTIVTGLEQVMRVDQVAVAAETGVVVIAAMWVVLVLLDKDLLEQTVLNQPFI